MEDLVSHIIVKAVVGDWFLAHGTAHAVHVEGEPVGLGKLPADGLPGGWV